RMRQLPFFAGFEDAVLWEALRLGTPLARRGGTTLIKEGAGGDSFYVLLAGTVSVMRQGIELAQLDPGVTLGEMAYLQRDKAVRTASALAKTDVLLLEIKNEALRRATDELQMRFDKAFIELLVQRLVATTQKLRHDKSDGIDFNTA